MQPSSLPFPGKLSNNNGRKDNGVEVEEGKVEGKGDYLKLIRDCLPFVIPHTFLLHKLKKQEMI